jgi:nicotinate-nucleotide adenylyltransferase
VRVAFFGGSFNPPHVAHVLAVAYALTTEEIDRVLVVPTYRHPFAKTLAPYEDRVLMCRLSMAWMPNVEVSRVEEELGGDGKTLLTLERLASQHPDWKMRLLIGADLLSEAPRWYRFDAVSALAPPLVLGRHGATAAGAPTPILPAISSTEVRAMIAAGAWEEVGHLVPREVVALVRARGLYA